MCEAGDEDLVARTVMVQPAGSMQLPEPASNTASSQDFLQAEVTVSPEYIEDHNTKEDHDSWRPKGLDEPKSEVVGFKEQCLQIW